MQPQRYRKTGLGSAARSLRLTLALALALCAASSAVAEEATAGNGIEIAIDAGLRSFDPVLFGDRLVSGYPLTHGRFNKAETKLGHLERVKSHVDLALHIDLAVLRQWPGLFDDDRIAYEYARRFLAGEILSRFAAGCRYGSCSTTMPATSQ